jgi:tripartite-type tricarboxylate transporter receptor subunit TctC
MRILPAIFSIALLLISTTTDVIAQAAAFPSKPIRVLIPYPPGGGTDTAMRIIQAKLQEGLGQPIILENRPGGSETIGTDALAKSAPDGHTIGLVSNAFSINATLFPKLPFDVHNDFAPVTLMVVVPFVMVAHPAVPANSVKELVALAKSQPGKLNFASLGSGSPHFLAFEYFKMLAGLDIVAVPYKGLAPAMTAVTAGEVQLMLAGLTAGLPQVKAGKFKALAVTPAKRLAVLPDVPTVAESGYAEYDVNTWYAILAPRGTPTSVVSRLNAEFAKALNAPDSTTRFTAMGVEVATSTPDELWARIRREIDTWGRIIRATGAKPE